MFADRIKTLRKEKGLTQIQFAQQFNVANGTVGMWETGKREPDFETTQRIADFFGVSVDYLLGREGQKETPGTKAGREVTFDDFTYAMYEEGKELTEENKKKLLEMAQFFRQQQERDKG